MDDSVRTSITVIFQLESQFQNLQLFLVLSVRDFSVNLCRLLSSLIILESFSLTFGNWLSFLRPSSSQKKQSFMNMMTSATNDQEEDDDDDDDEEFVVKKESTPHPKGLFTYVCVVIVLSILLFPPLA